MKEVEDDTNKWKEYPCSWIGRTNIIRMSTTQSNLQISCNPNQNTNSIFHRTRANDFKIHVEPQKTLNSQSNLEKKEQNWRYDNPTFRDILQSYSNQNGVVMTQEQTPKSVEWNKIRSPEINP